MDYHALPDADLLSEFARTRSDEAFRALVDRHVDLVHSAAVRQTHDRHLAEDVTQAVFLALSQRANQIDAKSLLAGWLILATRNVSWNARRSESRNERRERRAAAMNKELSESAASTPAEAAEIESFLDDALAELSPPDRNAIVQRFFQSKSHREVGRSLGIPEDTAAKRVTRALAKLRVILERHGITASEASLSAVLPVVAVKSAPAGLAGLVQAGLSSASQTVQTLAGSSFDAAPFVATSGSPFSDATLSGGMSSGGATSSGAASSTVPMHGARLYSLVSLLIVVLGAGVWVAAGILRPPPVAAPTPAPTTIVPPVPPAGARTVTFVMIDPLTRLPLPDAAAQVAADALPARANDMPLLPTGTDGRLVVPVPERFGSLAVNLRAPGRVPARFEFDNSMLRGALPPTYTVPMEMGVSLGGTVVDDLGEPVAGALVRLEQRDRPAFRAWTASVDGDIVVTDVDGRWTYDGAPADDEGVSVRVAASGFAPRPGVRPPYDALLRKTHTLSLSKVPGGESLRGIVLDEAGHPVASAKVVATEDKFDTDPPTTLTTAGGHFVLGGVLSSVRTLLVTSPRHAPTLVHIGRPDSASPSDLRDSRDSRGSSVPRELLRIRLERPVKLEGRVVASDGRPVPDAIVELESWRGKRLPGWFTRTDAEGRFEWRGAPADPLRLSVVAKEFTVVDDSPVTPGRGASVIRLFPPLRLGGTVTDADTKSPVGSFRIIPGVRQGKASRVVWQPAWSREIADGRYDAVIPYFPKGGKLRVEADGYLPAESRMIDVEEGALSLNFELKKGIGPRGVVVDPAGRPRAGVRVVCVPQGAAYVHEIGAGRDDPSGHVDLSFATTDSAGRFALKPQGPRYDLLAIGDDGFAHLNRSKMDSESPSEQGSEHGSEARLRLAPWSKLEGSYTVDDAPASKTRLCVSMEIVTGPSAAIVLSRSASTDADGRLGVDRVPAGAVQLFEAVPADGGGVTLEKISDLTTVSGETLAVRAERRASLPPAHRGPPPGE